MSKTLEENFKDIKEILDSDKVLKTIVYVSVGLVVLHYISKSFTSFSNTAKDVYQLHSVLNGKLY